MKYFVEFEDTFGSIWTDSGETPDEALRNLRDNCGDNVPPEMCQFWKAEPLTLKNPGPLQFV
jgi:hypothetical protein